MSNTLNRDVYAKAPEQLRLLNNGVAKVADAQSASERATLRFELENFVCEGQYRKGMVLVLQSFLAQLGQPEQKAIWVSGFYGSGKSHFLKMLRALWTDFCFDDGATARGLAHLPQDVKDLLQELSTAARRTGGLHAASGTLSGSAGDSVRLAVLGIVMRSLGLPEAYPQARFQLWLQREGKYAAVQQIVESAGKDWHTELQDMHVSTVLADAVLRVVPDLGASELQVREALRAQYPHVDDISNAQLVDIVAAGLASAASGTGLPLTLLALDEVQQFIAESADRSMRIQETVEELSRRLGSRIVIIGSGQSALTGTQLLQRLLGRFQIQIPLSDADVSRVLREVVLKKKPDAVHGLRTQLESCQGEIARHLRGTKIGHRQDDAQDLVADYPLLPVRRRFWDEVLRAVGEGTTGQLRNQLTMVYDAVHQTAEQEVGTVVAGDFLFDQQSTNLVQTQVLPRDSFERIQGLRREGTEGEFKSRICGLVFLIGKLPRNEGIDLGLRATPDVLADLLVTDLRAGTADLRKRVAAALVELESAGVVLNIGSEYRLQTRQSAEWEADYRAQAASLEQGQTQLAVYRSAALRAAVTDLGPFKKGIVQGLAKVARDVAAHLAADRPTAATGQLTAWVRDGWSSTEAEVLADARAAGPNSPLVFVFLPMLQGDGLRAAVVRWKAADATLAVRPVPIDPEGIEARTAIETRMVEGEKEAKKLVASVLAHGKVWVGGGTEVAGDDLADAIQKALQVAVIRLYTRFSDADHARWGDVVADAKKRVAAPLDKVGHQGNTESHAVTKEILQFAATGRKGTEIRQHFQAPPFGWPQDAIDGALYALAGGGHLRVTHSATHAAVDGLAIQQNQLTQHTFRAETVVVSGLQRIQLNKLAQDIGAKASATDAAATARNVVEHLRVLAERAGGEGPRPATPVLAKLEVASAQDGNALVAEVVACRDEFLASASAWSAAAAKISERMPRWQTLQQLLKAAEGLPEVESQRTQAQAIAAQRLLAADPDPVPGLCDQVTQALRLRLQAAVAAFKVEHDAGMALLAADPSWGKLLPDQKHGLLQENELLPPHELKVGTEAEVLASIRDRNLGSWADKRKALPRGFQEARADAARLLEPKVQNVRVPGRMIKTEAELDSWLAEVRSEFAPLVGKGPVFVQ